MFLYVFIFTEGPSKAFSLPQGILFKCIISDPLAFCHPFPSKHPGWFALALLNNALMNIMYVGLCLLYGHTYVTYVYYRPREVHQKQRHAAGHPCI